MFKYMRFKIFTSLMQPFSKYTRKRRLAEFTQIVKPYQGMKILDLGGQPCIWDFIDIPLDITCLNLPGVAFKDHITHHNITYTEGDACNMPGISTGQYDLVFSNSAIEHVGNIEKRKQFAKEVLRISKNFWIQTPSKAYPLEAHCGMPFWWFYPDRFRSFFLKKWKKKLPAWTEMVAGTTIVSKKELISLFPTGKIKTEWVIFPKSYTIYNV
ncbi:MAG: methyltransferase domain-containing protein [Gammaproteobacteria bacterium]|nr:methyltransferase domain-containing protein [Gammaproteobacteria bacterium]